MPAAPSADCDPAAGGSRELLGLAWPLILSNGVVTAQLTLDRMMLSWHGRDDVAAAFQTAMLFWLPFGLLQATAAYTATFVAQYTGAGRPGRVGPAVWQGVHFSVATGLMFLGLWWAAPWYVGLGGHSPAAQALEVAYLRPLCFVALPGLVTATLSGFFSGRGEPVAVLVINAVGTAVNVALAYVLIFGRFGLPDLGIVGAGWAAVAGAWASAGLAFALFLRKPFRDRFGTLAGWRPEAELFRRLLKYGGPAGVMMAVDVLAFTLFTVYVGRLGTAAAAATGIAVTLNLSGYLPTIGMGQAVAVLVGRRLGEDRPDLAAASARRGVGWAVGYMTLMAAVFVLLPRPLVRLFGPDAAVAGLVPRLLALVAAYSLADAVSVVVSGALRGAGDTRFVTGVAFGLAVPVMVVPAWLVVEYGTAGTLGAWADRAGGQLYLAWAFATLYIILVAAVFALRFRSGRWRAMRVIEPTPT